MNLFNLLNTYYPLLLSGAYVSLIITFLAFLIGLSLALLIVYIDLKKIPIIKEFLFLFINIIRGAPVMVQLGFFYYGLPSLGISISPILCAIISLGICSAAYLSEVLRGGILAVPEGQIDAAKTLGLSRKTIWRYIILPQAFRNIFPALGNELIMLSKDSSIASTIGVIELFKRANEIARTTYDYVTVLGLIALIYIVWTTFLSLIWKKIEKVWFFNSKAI
jgi:His/Glu/Gln/Arg/opine family amino acid ABC transporter permease subunit